MRYILTGCAGFIGTNLGLELLKQGNEVVGIDNLDPYYPLEMKNANLDALRAFEGFSFIHADISEPATYDALTGDFDGIFHLAAKAGVRPSMKDPVGYTISNLVGTARVLDFASKNGISRVVIASSSSVYGWRETGEFRETDPTDQPESPYAATKKAMESLAMGIHKATGMNMALLRYFTVFGPRVRPDLAMSKFILNMDRDLPITVFGDGSSQRDYTYVDNVVNATIAAMNRVTGFEIINVGTGRPINLMDMIAVISKVLGKTPKILHESDQPGDVPRTWADITKARNLLGYAPAIKFEDAVRITARFLLKRQIP